MITSQANSDSYKSNSNAKKCACNESRISEEGDVGIRNSRRKGDFDHTNEESNWKSSEEEEIKLLKCGRKGDAKNLNERTKENISEEPTLRLGRDRKSVLSVVISHYA